MASLRLFLLRHAKSSWSETGVADIDRPLSKRGRKEAVAVADLFEAASFRPARILCSSALRTRETLATLLPVLSADTEVIMTRWVYEADPERLLGMIKRAGGDAPELLVVGHNPTLEQLAAELAQSGEPEAIGAVHAGLPTAGLVVLRFESSDWAGIATGTLEAFYTPARD